MEPMSAIPADPRRRPFARTTGLLLLGLLAALVGCGGAEGTSRADSSPELRPVDATLHGRWIGNAIAYGPHRDGQAPGGQDPTRAQIREDLHLMAETWNLLRVYGSVGPARTVLEVIEEDELPLKVMLGVWIAPVERLDAEGRVVETDPEAEEANRAQIEAAVELAERHGPRLFAISVGNETQVSWSAHRCPPGQLLDAVREVRERVSLPVTVADDFSWWVRPESREIAEAIDFLTVHVHPVWNGRALDESVQWTAARLDEVAARHPDRPLVLGEVGWATQRHDEGEQARLIRGALGEDEQAVFHRRVRSWADSTRTVTFFFEAFDENWKGGEHPDEVEKHWGLYRADRSPKRAMTEQP